MQYVNDDMDDVFRRAAEDYPLDTRGADWNKVLVAMGGKKPANDKGKKSNKNQRFLWLLLLLPLGLICNRLYSPGSLEKSGNSEIFPVNQYSGNIKDEMKNKTLPGTNNSIVQGLGQIKPENNKNDFSTGSVIDNKVDFHRDDVPLKQTVDYWEDKAGKNFDRKSSDLLAGNETNKINPDISSEEENSFLRKQVTEVYSDVKILRQPAFIISDNLSPVKNHFQSTGLQPVVNGGRKRFYAGLMAGIDFTTIKLQKVEKKGNDYGILLGYQINKRWSVESGINFSSKYYYTDGKYLNTSKIYIPPNSRIDEASGDCKMIEVPISVRYNFSPYRKSGWFTTLGATSYFMKEEKYVYQYYYGMYGPVTHDGQYKNSSDNLFSNISISIGYTKELGRFADLRIEPYLKVPVSGMGIAELPLFSAGIHVGAVKKF